ncbi:MAG: DUF3783 domain-containing protein [Parasporobacterium sp.]|nr:DUF3783 domain-containing protein [Parasporobacterium sp.]
MKKILYNVKENSPLISKEKQLLGLCSDLGIAAVKLGAADMMKPLSALLTEGTSSEASESMAECLIFSGFEGDSLDVFLARYRERNIPVIPLKAVVTPYNINWTLGALLLELDKEHKEMSKR